MTFHAYFNDEENSGEFNASFIDKDELKAKFNSQIIIIDKPDYEGPYHVIPKAWIDQRLETTGRVMRDDVTVEEVPYTEVSNPEGTTCIIATE